MLMKESEEMRVAGEKLLDLSADREAQEIAEARRLALWERNHIWEARETRVRGEEREIADMRVKEERKKADDEKAELLQKDKLETAKRLLTKGFLVEDVAEGTGLDHSVVSELV